MAVNTIFKLKGFHYAESSAIYYKIVHYGSSGPFFLQNFCWEDYDGPALAFGKLVLKSFKRFVIPIASFGHVDYLQYILSKDFPCSRIRVP